VGVVGAACRQAARRNFLNEETIMRVHHIRCGTMCPLARRIMQGEGGVFEPAELVCHCLLVETVTGLVLVDTGLGLHDLALPNRISGSMRAMLRPHLDRDDAAITQVRRYGYNPSDVRDIVLTHLDFDHAGGLSDFPKARVHVLQAEHMAAHRRDIPLGRSRYRPAQWSHSPDWVLYTPSSGERWFGFECVRNLAGLPPEILLIPLIGHSPGHAGVAVRVAGKWQLHAGDAYFMHSEMNAAAPHCPPGLSVLEKMMQWDAEARLDNQRRLRDLITMHGGEVEVFCAHDPHEYQRYEALEPRPRTPYRPAELHGDRPSAPLH
jgi:glyoxylase-like metal-dependent hydrolase (beta-lactamase superfamily II)